MLLSSSGRQTEMIDEFERSTQIVLLEENFADDNYLHYQLISLLINS